jgi:hypothetical protein
MNAKHLAAARVIEREPAAVAAFWALVDCSLDPHSCWRWRGRTDRCGQATMRVWHTTVQAVRVASYAVTGHYPTASRYAHACGDPTCVRPSHLRWSTSRAHRRDVEANSDGYGGPPNDVSPAAEWAAVSLRSVARLAS